MIKKSYFNTRTLIHIPHGVLPAYLAMFQNLEILAAVWTLAFIAYEGFQDWRIKDSSYKDIFSFLIGFAITVTIGAILK